ncbi:unnamed protein product, partial [Effrenium voratum]
ASVNSSRFTRLFGLPLSWLYDAMDPLTTTAGVVWEGNRPLRAVQLRALKIILGARREAALDLGGLASAALGPLLEVSSTRGCVEQEHRQVFRSVWLHCRGGRWRLRVDPEDPFARYIYRFAYQASA